MKNKKEDKKNGRCRKWESYWKLDGAYEITNDENGKAKKTEDVTEKVKENKTRLFASFRNEKEQNERLDDLINKMPKNYKFDLVLFIGQLESTFIDGFSEEKRRK